MVAAIVPWNYPILLMTWKVPSALAAGNSVIIKPSEMTPLTALLNAGQVCTSAEAVENQWYAEAVALTQAVLGSTTYAAPWADGRKMLIEEAIAFALGNDEP